MKNALLVPDPERLRRKLTNPPPLLAKLQRRFQERLAADPEFRRHHIFLPALLGDPAAIAEAREQIVTLAADPVELATTRPGARTPPQNSLDHHIWCIAPRAMRIAAYFTWLDLHGVWTPAERCTIGAGLLDFFDNHVIPVLRARTPGGHNQQFSMTFCSTVVGHAFADVDGVAERACRLRNWAFPKLTQTLGLLPASGYSGEGTTYQSDVVAALTLWAGVFLKQIGEHDVWNRRWTPNGWRMADTLRMEALMCSCGGWLPPWDQYGWQRVHNLAARTLWAELSGDAGMLRIAEDAWDEPHHLAWRPDDRLWTLIYWPEEEGERWSVVGDRLPVTERHVSASPGQGHSQPSDNRKPTTDNRTPNTVLSGWSVPVVGAAVEHLPRRLRVMAAWDECSGSLQGLGRAQVNPNHLMIDLAGEPVTGDGWDLVGLRLTSDEARERTRHALPPVQMEMIARQYGSFERWVRASENGFLGASCAIIVDGWDSYFPRKARQGQLVFERRTPERHTFAGEAAPYYQPAFDVTRMRRTVSMGASGVTWIVDDIRSGSPHMFTWRMWLRGGLRQAGPQARRLDLQSGVALALGWRVETEGEARPVDVRAEKCEAYPLAPDDPRTHWPSKNTTRCEVNATGRRVRFVTCLVPEGVDGLQVRQMAPETWEAVWAGGADTFVLPPEVEATPDPAPIVGAQIAAEETVCDLDEAPYGLIAEPDAVLLAALDSPPVEAFRRTGAAMLTLTIRGCADAMPKIMALLEDARQNYTVHSVAAWCLGRAQYRPALELLRRVSHIPEVNTALRAGWAVERMEASKRR
jgi:hypothetical protein